MALGTNTNFALQSALGGMPGAFTEISTILNQFSVASSTSMTLDTTGASGTISIGPTNGTTVKVGNTTNPALQISSGTSGTGISITSAAAASGVAVAVISSGTNEGMTLNAKGSGQIVVGGTSTGLISLGRGSANVIIESSTKATLNSGTSVTATAANLLGGYVIVSGQTAATTLTTDTAANLDAAISGVATGDCFFVTVYNANTSSGAVTLQAGSSVTLKGTAALPISKAATLFFQRTGSGTWDCVATVSA